MRSGLYTGFASGAIACFTALLLIVFGMKFILTDLLNAIEWHNVKAASDTNSMATYFAYQTLAGAIMHLIILGVIMGLLLGIIGGSISKLTEIVNKKSL